MNLRDYHPYPPFIPRYTTKLIVGSIPPHRFCKDELGNVFGKLDKRDVDFYYGSYRNQFWKIIQKIYQIELQFSFSEKAIMQRKEFLEKENIALLDIIQSCKRVNNKSSDKDLYDIEWRNLEEVLLKNPSIQKILCTSQFVRKAVFQILKPAFVERNNESWIVEIYKKKFEIVQLYSPSPLLIFALGKHAEETRLAQYARFLQE